MSACNPAYFTARTACPVCGDATAEQVYDAPYAAAPVRDYIASHYLPQGRVRWDVFEGTDFTMMKCRRCGLLYQKHVPTAAMFDLVYNEMVEPAFLAELERQRLTIDNFNEIAGEFVHLFRLTGKHPSEIRFLDFGFGYGRWARVARALGATVFATETGNEKKRLAASIGVEIIDDADIEGMRFDIVHTEQVLEHVAEPGAEFRRLARATSGLFKVAVPVARNIEQLLRTKGLSPESSLTKALAGKSVSADDEAYMAVQPLEHLNTFQSRTMDWLAAQNGMAVVSRKRRRAVSLDLSGAGAAKRTAIDLAKMAAKRVLPRDSGYYLFRPA